MKRSGRNFQYFFTAVGILATALSAQAQTVTNSNTTGVFPTLSAAIADAATLDGHTLVVSGAISDAAIAVNKAVAITAAGLSDSITANTITFSAVGASLTGVDLNANIGVVNFVVCTNDTTITDSVITHTALGNNVIVANGGTITLDSTTVTGGVRGINVNTATLVVRNGSIIQNASSGGIFVSADGADVTVEDSTIQNNAQGADPAPGTGQFGQIIVRAANGPTRTELTNTVLDRGSSSQGAAISISSTATGASGPNEVIMTGGSIVGGDSTFAGTVGIIDNASLGVADITLSGLTTFDNPGANPTVFLWNGTLLIEDTDVPLAANIGSPNDVGYGVYLGNIASGTLNNVSFTRGAALRANATNGAQAVALFNSASLDMNGCTLNPPGDAGGATTRLFLATTGSVSVSDSVFDSPVGSAGAPLIAAVDSDGTFTNCTFTSLNFSVANAVGTSDLTFVNPTLAGQNGGVAFTLEFPSASTGGSITLQGNGPSDKLNLTGVNTTLLVRGLHGTLNLTDVEASGQIGGLPWMVDNFGSGLLDDFQVNLIRCDFTNGAGALSLGSGGGAFSANVNATNTLWQGPLPAGAASFIEMGGSQTGPSSVVLFHSTIDNPEPAVAANINTGRGDLFFGEYSIFNQGNAAGLSGTAPLSTNTVNLVNATVPFTATPSGTILADPLLTANGRLGTGSPAIDAAAGSGATDDIDGDVRPQAAERDLGADEATFTNVPDWIEI